MLSNAINQFPTVAAFYRDSIIDFSLVVFNLPAILYSHRRKNVRIFSYCNFIRSKVFRTTS